MYIFQPHAVSPLIQAWMVDQRLKDVLGSIIAAHTPGWDGSYKCMQSMFVTRKAGAPGSPWHQDEHPIPTRDRSLCGIWIALSDTTTENGALWVVRDSHKPGIIYDRKPHALPAVDSMPQAVGFEEQTANAVPLPMKRGDVLCFVRATNPLSLLALTGLSEFLHRTATSCTPRCLTTASAAGRR